MGGNIPVANFLGWNFPKRVFSSGNFPRTDVIFQHKITTNMVFLKNAAFNRHH